MLEELGWYPFRNSYEEQYVVNFILQFTVQRLEKILEVVLKEN